MEIIQISWFKYNARISRHECFEKFSVVLVAVDSIYYGWNISGIVPVENMTTEEMNIGVDTLMVTMSKGY